MPGSGDRNRRSFLDDGQIRTIALFLFLYFIVFFIGVTITAAYGNSLADSLFEYASSLSTVGLSIGVTSADAPVGLLWTQIVGMFLGRLEFFTVFVGIISLFKDIPSVFFGKSKRTWIYTRISAICLKYQKFNAYYMF